MYSKVSRGRSVALAFLVALCLAGLPAAAQNGGGKGEKTPEERSSRRVTDLSRIKVTLDLEDAVLPTALKELLKQVKTNYLYALDAPTPGRMTFSVKNVPFEGALVCILRSVKAQTPLTYGDDSGLLVIAPGGFSGPPGDSNERRFTFDMENVDMRSALKAALSSVRASYVLDQAVQGKVSVARESVSFRSALESILRAARKPLGYRVENGTYLIFPKAEEPPE
jgi:type II secretory pathway component HofQ